MKNKWNNICQKKELHTQNFIYRQKSEIKNYSFDIQIIEFYLIHFPTRPTMCFIKLQAYALCYFFFLVSFLTSHTSPSFLIYYMAHCHKNPKASLFLSLSHTAILSLLCLTRLVHIMPFSSHTVKLYIISCVGEVKEEELKR